MGFLSGRRAVRRCMSLLLAFSLLASIASSALADNRGWYGNFFGVPIYPTTAENAAAAACTIMYGPNGIAGRNTVSSPSFSGGTGISAPPEGATQIFVF